MFGKIPQMCEIPHRNSKGSGAFTEAGIRTRDMTTTTQKGITLFKRFQLLDSPYFSLSAHFILPSP